VAILRYGRSTMTNKLLLAAIALGLWANAAISLVRPAQAQYSCIGVDRISDDIHALVTNGSGCRNSQICR